VKTALNYSYPSFLPYTIFWHHLYHSLFISFFFLTGPLCMLNAYHIIPIFIISSSYCFCHICLCLAQQFYCSSSYRVIYFLVFKVACSDKLLYQQQRSFMSLWFIPTAFDLLTICVSLWESQEIKVEWTLLTACVCKYRYSPD
jgi:hypothetical protein